MKNTFKSLLLTICLFTSVTFAASQKPAQPVYFKADSVHFNNLKHQGVYRGHVEVKQGASQINAEKMTTLSDANNQLIKATAFGQKRQAHFRAPNKKQGSSVSAFADKIEFYPTRHKIILIGRAKVLQGKNRFEAPKIEYNTVTQQVITARTKLGRTRITFYSKKANG